MIPCITINDTISMESCSNSDTSRSRPSMSGTRKNYRTKRPVNGGSGLKTTPKRPKPIITNMDKADMWKSFEVSAQDGTDASPSIACVYETDISDDFCYVCGSVLQITPDQFKSCSESTCGIIYRNMTNNGAEWRSGAEDTTNSARCGMPVNPLLKESSFGCSISASGSATYEMRKLKKYSDWQAMPYKEKTLYDDFKYIGARANIVGLPKIITDVAMRYYTLLSENSTFRGLNRDGIVAASIYISCRVNGVPRTPKEISDIFGIDTTSATKGCKNAVAIIRELERGDDKMRDMVFAAITPNTFIDRYSNRVGLNGELSKLCTFICVIVNKKSIIPGNTPHSIAAGVLYYVCEKFQTKITKSAISQCIDISEVTISKCHKQLCETDIPLIPDVLLKKYKIGM